MLTVGADIGKYKMKIKWRGGTKDYLSKIAVYHELRDNIDEEYTVIEYGGKKYFTGELADREGNENLLNSPDIYKSNHVTLLNLLIGLSKLPDDEFRIVVGNPLGVNNQLERTRLNDLLSGIKEFKVNGKSFRKHVLKVGIAPEGLAAWYSQPNSDDLNIWDFGSSTIHAIAVRKRKLLDSRSRTFDFGFETMVDNNYEGLMESLASQMEKKWNDGNPKVMCIGGKAVEMFQYVRKYYANAILHNNPEFANALGLYEMGVAAYETN